MLRILGPSHELIFQNYDVPEIVSSPLVYLLLNPKYGANSISMLRATFPMQICTWSRTFHRLNTVSPHDQVREAAEACQNIRLKFTFCRDNKTLIV